ncbi:MAG: S8 family serine peptidase [Bdellovibrionales bacterium]|nr:S8 family serine peptidase [Bdellovibrionales bacterium]
MVLNRAKVRHLLSLLATLAVVTVPSVMLAQEYVPGEVIIKLKGSGKTMKAQAFIGKAVSEKAMTLKGSYSGLNMHHFKLGDGQDLEVTLRDLRNDPDVEYAEPNYILKAPGQVGQEEVISMSDVRAQSAVAASSTVGTLAQTNAPIQLQNAWSQMSSSVSPVVVAIIDTGVDMNHEVFVDSGAIWTNPNEIASNGIDDDANGYIDDVHGWNFAANNNSPMDDDNHGTHVAGIVLGTTQDIAAFPMQPAAIRIMPLKFLDSSGMGTTSDAVKAIYYAVNNGAKVLNNSWGGGGYSNSLLDAIAFAYSRRVVFVAAAGNSSSNNDVAPTYPANYSVPGVISVASTTDADGLSSFSNYGLSTVHVGSPGSSIWSSLPNNFYGRASGTSMATPFVAGLAALMLRENSSLSAYQVRELLFAGAQKISSLQTKTTTKARINAYNSVVAAKAATGDSSQPSFAASSREPASAEVAAGCGVVKALIDDASGPSGTSRNVAFFGLLVLFAAPVVVALALRQSSGKSRRRFPRYDIASTVRLKVGDRELVGNVNSISMGGVSLQTDAWLENGGVVTMSIKSPDGREEIQVGGKIVWSEEKKRYGVAFEGADSSSLNSIARWTSGC